MWFSSVLIGRLLTNCEAISRTLCWVNYYGRFQRSALHTVFDPLNRYLERWLRRKYKRLKYKVRPAREMLRQIRRRQPALFAHWALAAHGWQ